MSNDFVDVAQDMDVFGYELYALLPKNSTNILLFSCYRSSMAFSRLIEGKQELTEQEAAQMINDLP